MTFGERISSIRKRLKWSQDELAKKVGTSGPIIGRYERNEIKPAIDTAKSIADALGVTIDFLMGDDDMVIDKKLFQKIKDIESFTEEEKTKIYDLLDMAVGYHKAKKKIFLNV
ncbi:helix-turn-helix domain-containing protein [Aquimarina pacifica]|uniref:helix-turn-helix domain-containing protein n=1 Tax=Aquimarina pacifica TaxID=1296415 RepID=UPI000471D034|nr:helix-turn-helix transcriptional regulator [Aquimarina pacifica]